MRFVGRSLTVGLAAAWLAVGCGYSEEEMQAKRDRIADLEGQLQGAEQRSEELSSRITALEARNGELVERLRALGEEVEGLESERGSLQSSLQETQRALDELRERERQAQQRLATFRNMLQRFQSMIDSGRLRVRITRNRMLLELSENILFDSGRAGLREEGEAALAEIVEVLNSIPDRQFQVAGHTDNIPMRSSRFDSNWELSAARAVNVARYMIEQGMSAERISAAGYADTQPVASNETGEGRAQNRRIEIVLLPNLDELPDLSSLADEGEGSS
ncbi:MAG TPA: OmpA family protein [Sandaracinaceae bacterium LLY-WYZ-13_1]|nr:OmpA family protein [Sandaracinaceae bacterium LLY-WYZ-13_1]